MKKRSLRSYIGQKQLVERVLLIYPPIRVLGECIFTTPPPLGVAYLASSLRNECDVAILDATIEGIDNVIPVGNDFVVVGLSNDEIIERIKKFKPQVIGLSCIFSSHILVIRELLSRIKQLDSSIITVIGGTYPTFLYEKCMEDENLDFICLGEGEATAVELIRGLREGSIENIDGLVMRGKDGEIIANQRKNFIKDLDKLPFPAWDLMPMPLYSENTVPHSITFKSKKIFTLLTSRGCPSKCIFCSSTNFWGNKYRTRSPENVLEEIDELVNKWGIEEIQFEDDNMTLNKERAKAIFRGIIDSDNKIYMNFPNAIALWSVDDEMVRLMKEAGCYEATLAFESGCQHVLDNIIKKPLDLQKARYVRSLFRKYGIRTNAFYIVGFPGETKEQIKETFKFARSVGTESAYFFAANPLPGSELHKIVKEKGYLEADFEFTEVTYTRGVINTPDFRGEEIENMIYREVHYYHLLMALKHPVVFLKKLMDIIIIRPSYGIGMFKKLFLRLLGWGRK